MSNFYTNEEFSALSSEQVAEILKTEGLGRFSDSQLQQLASTGVVPMTDMLMETTRRVNTQQASYQATQAPQATPTSNLPAVPPQNTAVGAPEDYGVFDDPFAFAGGISTAEGYLKLSGSRMTIGSHQNDVTELYVYLPLNVTGLKPVIVASGGKPVAYIATADKRTVLQQGGDSPIKSLAWADAVAELTKYAEQTEGKAPRAPYDSYRMSMYLAEPYHTERNNKGPALPVGTLIGYSTPFGGTREVAKLLVKLQAYRGQNKVAKCRIWATDEQKNGNRYSQFHIEHLAILDELPDFSL